MSWLGVVMARLLSSNEADCLISQHRKPSGFPMKNHHVETECIPRERFSPVADKRPPACVTRSLAGLGRNGWCELFLTEEPCRHACAVLRDEAPARPVVQFIPPERPRAAQVRCSGSSGTGSSGRTSP